MATAPKKQAEAVTVTPKSQDKSDPPKPMEIARSGPMDLRAMRQMSSSLYTTIQQFLREEWIKGKTLTTAQDTANEYAWILKEIDAFYARARTGIGDVKIFLVAESLGFTKQMEISIKDKEPESGGWVAEWRDSISLAK